MGSNDLSLVGIPTLTLPVLLMGASSLRSQSGSLCLVDPRYGMMHELAAFDIDRVIDGRPVTSEPLGSTGRHGSGTAPAVTATLARPRPRPCWPPSSGPAFSAH